MSDCNDLFDEYLNRIKVSPTLDGRLLTSKETIKEKINKYFDDEDMNQPWYCTQGSFKLKTHIRPLNNDVDVDYGIYLNNLDSNPQNWKTPRETHDWVLAALKAHAQSVKNKNNCVRVNYAPVNGDQYHVDIPIYVIHENIAYLASQNEGWIESDPKTFWLWFYAQIKENKDQIRKIIRILKGWRDYQDTINIVKLPSSIFLTVVIVQNFYESEDTEECLIKTIKNIYKNLSNKFELMNPASVVDTENLADKLSPTEKTNFLSAIKIFIESGTKAIEEDSKEKASEIWIELFGDRFPKFTEKKQTITSAPSILKDDARFA